jgi:agmatine deiminase
MRQNANQPIIRIPAEWEAQKEIWTALPWDQEKWPVPIDAVRAEIVAMVQQLSQTTKVKLMVHNDETYNYAKDALLPHENIYFVKKPYGDIRLRDTGAIFGLKGRFLHAVSFGHNGWGGKYYYPHDTEVNQIMTDQTKAKASRSAMILEGGSLEFNGKGTVLTTKQCLLNDNRNPYLSKKSIHKTLINSLGIHRMLWLDQGLLNDSTEGHIDNIARFAPDGRVICMAPTDGYNDPNFDVLIATQDRLTELKQDFVTIPSAGEVLDENGKIMPASHMNYIISNGQVIVPVYNEYGDAAVDALSKIFNNHSVVGLPAKNILAGGGSFHSITQHVPMKPNFKKG